MEESEHCHSWMLKACALWQPQHWAGRRMLGTAAGAAQPAGHSCATLQGWGPDY